MRDYRSGPRSDDAGYGEGAIFAGCSSHRGCCTRAKEVGYWSGVAVTVIRILTGLWYQQRVKKQYEYKAVAQL